MGWWADLAERRAGTPNHGGPMLEHRGLVVHIAEGSYDGTITWCFTSRGDQAVSAHFVVARDGRAAQLLDTDVTAWTQRAGNGHWLSVECEGRTPEALTTAQIETIAKIFARGCLRYGYPLQIATAPDQEGLGHHSMGTNGHDVPTDTWTGPTWGHEDCPGPPIIAQKPAILTRAITLAAGEDMSVDDARTALAQMADEAAQRSTPTGRAFANDLYAILRAGIPEGPPPAPAPVDPAALKAVLLDPEVLAAIAAAVNADAAHRLQE